MTDYDAVESGVDKALQTLLKTSGGLETIIDGPFFEVTIPTKADSSRNETGNKHPDYAAALKSALAAAGYTRQEYVANKPAIKVRASGSFETPAAKPDEPKGTASGPDDDNDTYESLTDLM